MVNQSLVERILERNEPDASKREDWMKQMELFPVSQSACIQSFVSVIQECKEKDIKVIVAGDYDCDGIMATSIMMDALTRYGIACGFYVPDRIKEGYGLNEDTIFKAHTKGYGCVITVDNGVKAHQALLKAKEYGMTTIVTDHHVIEEDVPCDVLVHPTLMEEQFSTLCGAAVAYECIRALGVDTTYSLEMAAVASIGDMMVVKGQTRAIIQRGLEALNTKPEEHISPLASDRVLNETSVAFHIVPKLNAVGRLSNLANVNNVVGYFLSQDYTYIKTIQDQIVTINDRRKNLSAEMLMQAQRMIHTDDGIHLVMDPGFHEGIIGWVAGSLCSQTNKPVIVLTSNSEGYVGSLRSPDGFHCMEFLGEFDGFQGYGGHANAAGFSFDLRNFEAFRSYVRSRIRQYQWQPTKKETLLVDARELNIEAIESLDALRPFGPGFECPPFEIEDPQIARMFHISNGKHCKYLLKSGLECMRFNETQTEKQKSTVSIHSFIGSAQVNAYRGNKSAVFIIDAIDYKG